MPMPKPLKIRATENAPTIQWAHLRSRRIFADNLSMLLLPYCTVTPEVIDILNEVLDLPDRRRLILRVGLPVRYEASLGTPSGDLMIATVTSVDETFAFPMTIRVTTALPLQPEDHVSSCRFGVTLGEGIYTLCNCPFLEYDMQEFIVNDSRELNGIKDYIQTAKKV